MTRNLGFISKIFFIIAAVIAAAFVIMAFVTMANVGFMSGVVMLLSGACCAFGSFAAGCLFQAMKDGLENDEEIYSAIHELKAKMEKVKTE